MQFKPKQEAKYNKEDLIRLKDKDVVVGVLRGNPVDFWTHYNGKFSEPCKGKATCEYCKNKDKARFRSWFNICIELNGAWTAKILEAGAQVYDALRELAADYDLEQHKIKISRSGSGMNDTTYTVLPVPRGEVTEAQEKLLKEVKLHDLTVALKGEEVPF